MSRRSVSRNSVTAGDDVELEQKGIWNETIAQEIYGRILYVCSWGQHVRMFSTRRVWKSVISQQSFLFNIIWAN